MNETENSPNLHPTRAHVCATCDGLGTVPDAMRPGAHCLCPACQRRDLAFTLPPEPPVTASECYPNNMGPEWPEPPIPPGFYRVRDSVRGSAVVNRLFPGDEVLVVGPSEPFTAAEQAAADRIVATAARHLHHRHDDLDGRLAVTFCAGLFCGAALVGGMLLWLA